MWNSKKTEKKTIMKNIYRISVFAAAALLTLSCQLDLMPITEYGTEKNENGGSENPYELRADIEGLRNTMYNSWVPTITFVGTLYYQVMSECRLDNSYNGTNNAKLLDIEANKISPSNEDVAVTWTAGRPRHTASAAGCGFRLLPSGETSR